MPISTSSGQIQSAVDIGRPHVTALTLNRLGERQIDDMIDRVIGNKPLPTNIRQDIVERTDGIPLFVEEMTKAVLEAEGEGAARQIAAAVPSSTLGVPASLHASLMARLDRLGSAKDVAQIGAAIGREFSYTLLAAVVAKPEAELQSALDRLMKAGLLFRQGVPPHATYLFKHGLVQDAAYSTMLREPRRALHARIAETIEDILADIAENRPEVLARHRTEAGQIERAAGLWAKAGQRSLAHSALVEAAEQFTRALNQIATLPTTQALRREEIRLQTALIAPYGHVKGFAAPETQAAVERAGLLIQQAEASGEPVEDPLLLFLVLYGLWVANFVSFNGVALCKLATQFLTLARQQKATAAVLIGHRLMGTSLICTGEIGQGREQLDRGIALYKPDEHRPLGTRFAVDIGLAILTSRSLALWMLGYPEAALADVDRALKKAREDKQAGELMHAVAFVSITLALCRKDEAAVALLDEVLELTTKSGAVFWKAFAMSMRGWFLGLANKPVDAVHMITSGITAFRSTGATVSMPSWLSILARAHADCGQFQDAWRCIGDAMNSVDASMEKWFEAELNRIAGEIALASSQPDAAKAEAFFERALAVARQQQAKSWELRASMSIARLWRDQGKPQQARELLAPVYGWFTEGFDTLDLKEAKALLDDLAA